MMDYTTKETIKGENGEKDIERTTEIILTSVLKISQHDTDQKGWDMVLLNKRQTKAFIKKIKGLKW